MSKFTPQRLIGESQAQYQTRRREAKEAVRAMRCIGLGDQHKHLSQREEMRAAARRRGTLKGTYGANLLVTQERRNQMRMESVHALRDDFDAYTLTGSEFSVYGTTAGADVHVTRAGQDDGEHFFTGRRIWVAGVSALRGF